MAIQRKVSPMSYDELVWGDREIVESIDLGKYQKLPTLASELRGYYTQLQIL